MNVRMYVSLYVSHTYIYVQFCIGVFMCINKFMHVRLLIFYAM